MTEFRELLRDLAPWAEAAKSLFTILGLIFAIVVIPIWNKIRELKHRNRYLSDELKVADEGFGEPAPAPEPGATYENWNAIRKKWREIRERTDELISTFRGQRRRDYDAMSRFSYDGIANRLVQQKKLLEEEGDALRKLDKLALGLRRSRAATAAQVENANSYYELLDKRLPAVG